MMEILFATQCANEWQSFFLKERIIKRVQAGVDWWKIMDLNEEESRLAYEKLLDGEMRSDLLKDIQ